MFTCFAYQFFFKHTQRTEGELGNKAIANNVMDLGKQLLQYARDSDVKGVKNMLKRGAPFTADWVTYQNFIQINILLYQAWVNDFACNNWFFGFPS